MRSGESSFVVRRWARLCWVLAVLVCSFSSTDSTPVSSLPLLHTAGLAPLCTPPQACRLPVVVSCVHNGVLSAVDADVRTREEDPLRVHPPRSPLARCYLLKISLGVVTLSLFSPVFACAGPTASNLFLAKMSLPLNE